MAYKKILVDNLVCSRRFHICFDDEGQKEPQVAVKCLHCDAVIYQKADHPTVRLLRDENLVKETDLSSSRSSNCQFQDKFPPSSKRH